MWIMQGKNDILSITVVYSQEFTPLFLKHVWVGCLVLGWVSLLTSTSLHRCPAQLISPKHLVAEQKHEETKVVKVQSCHRGLPWLGSGVALGSMLVHLPFPPLCYPKVCFLWVHSSFFSCKNSDNYLLPKNKNSITSMLVISLILCLHI